MVVASEHTIQMETGSELNYEVNPDDQMVLVAWYLQYSKLLMVEVVEDWVENLSSKKLMILLLVHHHHFLMHLGSSSMLINYVVVMQ